MSEADDDRTSTEDDVVAARKILGRGGRLPWTLLVLVLLGGGAAGAYGFQHYDAMRVSYDAASYRAQSDRERVEAAERAARAAESEAASARAALENERRSFRDERNAWGAERDRLRAGGSGSANGTAGGQAVLVSLRQLVSTPGTGEVRDEGGAVKLVIPARSLFNGNGAAVAPGGAALLDRVAEALRATPGALLEVRAYGDVPVARGAAAWGGAGARAAAVARYLAARGRVEAALVSAVAPGLGGAGSGGRVEIVVSAGQR